MVRYGYFGEMMRLRYGEGLSHRGLGQQAQIEAIMRGFTVVGLLGLMLLLLFGCGKQTAQVSGVVISSKTGQPLQGVEVTLGNRAAKTTSDGKYQFGKVVPGNYILQVHIDGYDLYECPLSLEGKRHMVHGITLSHESLEGSLLGEEASELGKLSPSPAGEAQGGPHLPSGVKIDELRAGDFSVALSEVKREDEISILYFAITKVTNIGADSQSLKVALIDDHGNEYSNELDVDLEGASDFVLNALPKGFTYVEEVEIHMPRIAPINKLTLGGTELSFKEVDFRKPHFLEGFGNLGVTKGQSVSVSKWLSFTIEQIIPGPRHWELPITVENKEYNSLSAGIRIAVQHADGTISWSSHESTNVPALSKALIALALPIPSWVEGGPPQPRALLLVYTDEREKNDLKMHSVSSGDLPPLVGQGPREEENVFLSAYQRNGGREIMGNPLNLLHWFAGGDKPKDENDLLIQQFPAVSEFGKSAIIWNKQGGTSRAYVLHGAIWEKYSSLGGSYFKSRTQGVFLGAPTSDGIPVAEGIYNTFQGGAMASHNRQTAAVLGDIYKKWEEKRLARGLLGFPIGEERSASSGARAFDTEGSVQRFEGGHIWLHQSGKYAGQTFETHGVIDECYTEQMHGSGSWLGFPIKDQIQGWATPYTYFEGGFVTTTDGQNYEAFRYGGNKIAFVSTRDGNKEVYVMDADGRNQMNLSQNEHDDIDPAWSPCGKYIAFTSNRTGDWQVWKMNADGETPVQLTQHGGQHPVWSSDGSKIAFETTREGNSEIYMMDSNGTNLTNVTRRSSDERHPSWSPNGTKIAYQSNRGGWAIYVMDLDVNTETCVAKSPYKWITYIQPTWSPLGDRIAFLGVTQEYKTEYGYTRIMLVDVTSLRIKEIPDPTRRNQALTYSAWGPAWSPDANWVVFSELDVGQLRSADGQLRVVRPDSQGLVKITYSAGNNFSPVWTYKAPLE